MTNKSCLGCPNFLDSNASHKWWGTDFGVPTCGARGNLLGMPGESNEDRAATFESFAADCPDFGVERPAIKHPTFVAFNNASRVASKVMPILEANGGRRPVTACRECANYIPSHVVQSAYGWNAGVCACLGAVLTSSQVMTMPQACPTSAHKSWVAETKVDITIRDSVDSSGIAAGATWARSVPRGTEAFYPLELNPEYSGRPNAVTVVKSSSPSKTRKRRKVLVDPTDATFSREASPEEKAFGILGWNALEMAGAKRPVEYPVFARWLFTDEEQSRIPSVDDGSGVHLYEDYDNVLFTVVGCHEKKVTPILVGPAGVGKTDAFRHLAFLMQAPFTRISIAKSTEADDLTGSWVLKDGSMEWVYGRLRTIAGVGVTLVDEPNMGINEVWEILRPLTDGARQLVLDKKDNEILHMHDHCYFGFAMNPAWDPLYIGAQDISVADQSRTVTKSVGYPEAAVEKRIVKDRCALVGYKIDNDDLSAIMKISREIRSASDKMQGGMLEYAWGIRSNITVALLTDVFDLRSAYKLAATDALDPDQAAIIHAIVESYLP